MVPPDTAIAQTENRRAVEGEGKMMTDLTNRVKADEQKTIERRR